jgi:hypothetical protein
MGAFLLRPNVSYDPGRNRRRPWRVEDECLYFTGVLGASHKLVVPRGYETDLASVPRVPGIYWRYGNTAVLPSIVHDYLYEFDPFGWGRKVADQVFLEAMRAERDPRAAASRWVMYQAVRVGGWRSWRRYRAAVPSPA